MSDSIFYGINKKKLRFQVGVYSVLALASFILFFSLAKSQEAVPPIILQGSGTVLLILFVLAAGAKAKKISDPKSGLLIDKQGVHDLSSDIALGLIKWKDIDVIKAEQSVRTGLILVMVKKNEVYLKKAKNSAIERLLRQNIRLYETPVAIDPSYLDGDIRSIIEKIETLKR